MQSQQTSILSAAGSTPIRVLLVDDQEIIARAVERMFVNERDIEFHYCQDPSQAIATAQAVRPTVILQDLLMPDVDGMTLVRFFRANPETRDVPLIVLSSKEEPATKAEAFACGANDYMVKLPDALEVIARVRYHSRGYIALIERNRAFEALARELNDAASYVASLLPPPLAGSPASQWCFVPSAQLGGDGFGYHWIDDDHFAVYLLDVCGHGVGAALLSVSALNVLRSNALPDIDVRHPGQVLAGLNRAFPMEDHNGMFFTIWYGVLNLPDRILRYASAGHPPAVLVTNPGDSEPRHELLKTRGMVIGGMPDIQFPDAATTVPEGSVLFVFSDGTYEVTNTAKGELWSLDDWTDLLVRNCRQTNLHEFRDQVAEIQGRADFDDDFSLLRIQF